MAIQSFLSNRPVAPSSRGGFSEPGSQGGFQRLFDRPPQQEDANLDRPRIESPQVDVIEENGRVASIVVTCRCCERIEIACRY